MLDAIFVLIVLSVAFIIFLLTLFLPWPLLFLDCYFVMRSEEIV
jgi:hypothetical protein